MNLAERTNASIAAQLEDRLVRAHGPEMLSQAKLASAQLEDLDPSLRGLVFEMRSGVLAPSVVIKDPTRTRQKPTLLVWGEYARVTGNGEGNYYDLVGDMELPLFHLRINSPQDPDQALHYFQYLTRYGLVRSQMRARARKDRQVYTFDRRYFFNREGQGVVVDLLRITDGSCFADLDSLQPFKTRLINTRPYSAHTQPTDQQYVQKWLRRTRNWPVSRT